MAIQNVPRKNATFVKKLADGAESTSQIDFTLTNVNCKDNITNLKKFPDTIKTEHNLMFELDALRTDDFHQPQTYGFDFKKADLSAVYTFDLVKSEMDETITDLNKFGEDLISAVVQACRASTPEIKPAPAKAQPWSNERVRTAKQRLEALKIKRRLFNADRLAVINNQI